MLAAGSHAQTFRERLQQDVSKAQQGASAVQKGASDLADRIDENVDSPVDLMTNEPTPQETRDELDAMAGETLTRLLAEQPEAADLFELSAGNAVFDTRKMVLFGLAAGAGRGVAVSRSGDRRIYMNMGTAGVGMSLGIGGFDSQIVLLFQEEWRKSLRPRRAPNTGPTRPSTDRRTRSGARRRRPDSAAAS